VYLFGQGTSEGLMFGFEVSAERVEKLPRWSPSGAQPPLPIGAAVQAAEEWIKKRHAEIRQFEVSTVALSRVTWPGLADRWYYRIEFQPIVGGQRLYGGQFIAVVLFDGSVVEPRVERRSEVR